MAHTSGIPSWSIRLIPEGTTEEMLGTTIHKISNIALDTYPGTEYQYATVNYDILAMIIEKVTGMNYQDYVTEHILIPLGMTDSWTGKEVGSAYSRLPDVFLEKLSIQCPQILWEYCCGVFGNEYKRFGALDQCPDGNKRCTG